MVEHARRKTKNKKHTNHEGCWHHQKFSPIQGMLISSLSSTHRHPLLNPHLSPSHCPISSFPEEKNHQTHSLIYQHASFPSFLKSSKRYTVTEAENSTVTLLYLTPATTRLSISNVVSHQVAYLPPKYSPNLQSCSPQSHPQSASSLTRHPWA